MRVCADCGAENGDGAQFCDECGAFIDWESGSGVVASDRRGSSPFVSKHSSPEATAPTPTSDTADPGPSPPADEPQPIEPQPIEPSSAADVAEVADSAPPTAADPPPASSRAEDPREPANVVIAPPSSSDAAAEAPEPAPENDGEPGLADPVVNERVRKLVARSSVLPTTSPSAPSPTDVADVAATVESQRSHSAAPEFVDPAPSAAAKPAASSLASVIKIADRSGRTDLATRLRASAREIHRTGVSVTVAGEYKKGKSGLVNALINAEVCPSDAVWATVAPIVVHHGTELTATVTHARANGGPEPIELDQVADFASEASNPSNQRGISQVSVALPRRLLATGLELIDTPGIGGLDSALGAATLGSLESADGVLFVTDCGQELTAPELSFLNGARQRCGSVVCVMTKRDVHQHADQLADINREHLARNGIDDVPVVTVSSLLHLMALAQDDPELEAESGFAELFDLLHERIWQPARRRGLARAGHELSDLTDQLSIPIQAARTAMDSSEAAAQTLDQLAEAQERVRQFRSTAARWQQRLAEGMQEAATDLDHDLRTRIRVVSRTAEGRADTDDIADDLVFEAWLHKATMDAVVGHYERIVERTSALADEVAEQFVAFDRHARFEVEGAPPTEELAAAHVAREADVLKDGVLRRVVTTTQGYTSGVILASSVLGVVSTALVWLPMLTLPVAGLMAKRAFSDDRARRRAARRQELKRLSTRYLDEVGFIVYKDSRDTVRRIHRQIREYYSGRAEQLELTLRQATVAAERARDAGKPDDPTMTRLDRTTAELAEVRGSADQLVLAAGA